MEEALAEVNAVAGVQGCFICDNRGDVIASDAPRGLDETELTSVGREVSQTLAALAMAGQRTNELDFMYEAMRVVAHDLGNATLIVLCEPRVEIAMLRLTLNVVLARLKGDSGIQSQIDARFLERELKQDDVDDISWHLLRALQGEEVNNA